MRALESSFRTYLPIASWHGSWEPTASSFSLTSTGSRSPGGDHAGLNPSPSSTQSSSTPGGRAQRTAAETPRALTAARSSRGASRTRQSARPERGHPRSGAPSVAHGAPRSRARLSPPRSANTRAALPPARLASAPAPAAPGDELHRLGEVFEFEPGTATPVRVSSTSASAPCPAPAPTSASSGARRVARGQDPDTPHPPPRQAPRCAVRSPVERTPDDSKASPGRPALRRLAAYRRCFFARTACARSRRSGSPAISRHP